MYDVREVPDVLERPGVLLDASAVKHLVIYSRSHIYSLQAAGDFPMHLKLGPGRVAWLLSDVIAWMQARLDERPSGQGERVIIKPGDRFISKKELRTLVPYTVNHLSTLEREGKFPRRVPLGRKRVGWLEREVVEWLWNKKAPIPG